MKRYLCAALLAVAASLALAATASADVPRYQIQTGRLAITLPGYGYVHTYDITVNPCNNTFTGTGSGDFGGAAEASTESITGTLVNGNLTYTATYLPGGLMPGYVWSYNGPQAGGTASDSTGLHFGITTAFDLTASTYKNHGDYVKSSGGGADAAHSCVGLPIQNVAMTFTALVPEGAANQWVNVWTHTYSINYDAVTHAFSGTGTTVGTLGGPTNTEAITGLYDGPTITFDAHYLTGPYSLDGVSDPQFDYKWHYSGPFDTVGWATSNLQWSPGVFQTLEVKVTEPVAAP